MKSAPQVTDAMCCRHRIEVIRDVQESPLLNIDKHKVLQILVTLVRYARYACDESQRPDRQLRIRVACAQGEVAISVIDNGVGIAPQNLMRIFNHGFTTRAEGHGFGLHSGALAARELGGSLSVYSEGLGKGRDIRPQVATSSRRPEHAA